MDNDVTASIIITCYNKEDTIKRAVMSAARQKFELQFEVIVVDDYSTDRSREILESIKIEFPNSLQLIFNGKNIGASASHNIGTKRANGDYCVSLDGDDWIEHNYLAALYPVIDSDFTIGIAYSGRECFGEYYDGREYSFETEPKEYDRELLFRYNYIPSCSMYRKKAWEEAGGYRDFGGWEDYGMWLGIIELGYRAVAVPGILFHYFQTLDNRAFHSALKADKLREMFKNTFPSYVGATPEEIEASKAYLTGRQKEIDYVRQAKLDPSALPRLFPELYSRTQNK